MQSSFSDFAYASKRRLTRRDPLLGEVEAVTPRAAMRRALEPFYPKDGGHGRLPIGLEHILRMRLAQNCIDLSDEGMEEAIDDSQAIRRFVGIDLERESGPDATILLKFRRFPEAQGLTKRLFEKINAHVVEKGLMMREGTTVDASIIAAPSSKKRAKACDLEIHLAKNGNYCHFELKAHIGADIDSGLVHTVVGTAANVADVAQANTLLHGNETYVPADTGYQGVQNRDETKALDVQWHLAMRPGRCRGLPKGRFGRLMVAYEQGKTRIRAKAEHPFHVVTNQSRHRKTRYHGVAKNNAQPFSLFAWPISPSHVEPSRHPAVELRPENRNAPKRRPIRRESAYPAAKESALHA